MTWKLTTLAYQLPRQRVSPKEVTGSYDEFIITRQGTRLAPKQKGIKITNDQFTGGAHNAPGHDVATTHHALMVSNRQMQVLAASLQRARERNDLEGTNELCAAWLTRKTQGYLAQAADHASDPAGPDPIVNDGGRKADQQIITGSQAKCRESS